MTITSLAVPPPVTAVDAWHGVVTAAHAHDLPAAVPAPGRVETEGKLNRSSVSGRTVRLAATAPDGSYDGVASLLLFTDEGNRHTAFLDVLAVHPRARRRGTGAALWRAVHAELTANGRTSLSTMLELGGTGQEFATGLGFEKVLDLGWYVQNVREALAAHPQPPELPEGYAYAQWAGVVPDAHADAFAEAHNAMEDAPSGDMDEQVTPWDADRVRAAAQVILDRGGVILSSAVLHAASGDRVAAYTELVLRDPSDARALQYDTVVTPDHRGRGLGRAVKRHMLGAVRLAQPGIREIATSVADDNGPMLAVNERLGYRRERTAAVFQLRL
ncbi:GNAT family N-acetyltransferase [Streptomyces sp. SLBN-118]|uniref:GNAT family N-acetyltransferase n=1 Tax=Streptomyces sp. SLBN-118 TaxID=2768454 RepID=UPI0011515AD6|nr:GNAT family N-acetyltransferase [Streptomyces sp. SLBN-118]